MKKIHGVRGLAARTLATVLSFLLLCLLASCGGIFRPSPAPAPSSSAPPVVSVPAPASEKAPASSPSEEDLFTPQDGEELIQMLSSSGYSSSAIFNLPPNREIYTEIIQQDDFYVPMTLVLISLWSSGDAGDMEGSVSGEVVQQTALDFFGVPNYNLENAPESPTVPGKFGVPPHGPMHSSELLPHTLMREGKTASVETLVSYFQYGEGVYKTATLRHTFIKNPHGATVPFQLVSILKVAESGSLLLEGVTEPDIYYDTEMIGRVNVPELNLRQGPGTDYDKVTLLTEGTLFSFLGESSDGEWLCSYSGWVKAEYITLLGPADAP